MTRSLSLHAQILAIGLTLGLIVVIFELVRRRRIQERYALLWVVVLIVLLLFTVVPTTLPAAAHLVGTSNTTAALLALLSVMELVLLVHLTSKASMADERLTLVQQEIALLRLEQELRERAHVGLVHTPASDTPGDDAGQHNS